MLTVVDAAVNCQLLFVIFCYLVESTVGRLTSELKPDFWAFSQHGMQNRVSPFSSLCCVSGLNFGNKVPDEIMKSYRI